MTFQHVIDRKSSLVAEPHDIRELGNPMTHRHHRGLQDHQIDLPDPRTQSLEHFDLCPLRVDLEENRMLQEFRQQRVQSPHRRRPRFTIEHLALDLREKTRSGNVAVDVEDYLFVFRSGGDEEVVGIEPLLQFFQDGETLRNRLDQKISGARKCVVDRRRSEGDADVDDGSDFKPKQFEVFEEQSEISNGRIGTQEPKTDGLKNTIDRLEHG